MLPRKRRRMMEGGNNIRKKGVIGAWFRTIETSNISTVYSKSCNDDAHGYVINMPLLGLPLLGGKPIRAYYKHTVWGLVARFSRRVSSKTSIVKRATRGFTLFLPGHAQPRTQQTKLLTVRTGAIGHKTRQIWKRQPLRVFLS